jgi:hypothetical protein
MSTIEKTIIDSQAIAASLTPSDCSIAIGDSQGAISELARSYQSFENFYSWSFSIDDFEKLDQTDSLYRHLV